MVKRLQHGLINVAAQPDQIFRVHLVRVLLRLGQPIRTPVNRMRFRQPPVERTPFGIHIFREHRINLVFFAEPQRVGPVPGGLRIDERFEICSVRAKKRRHFHGPLLFEIHVGVVEVLAHFVLKEPRQFAVNQNVIRVVTQTVVAQQFDGALDPAPTVGKILELDGNVVGHVPRLKQPDLREMRLQVRDPIRQLRRLEILVVQLQIIGAHPEQIGNQPAETAQRDRRERQHRRRVLQGRRPHQPELIAVAVQRLLHAAGTEEQRRRQQQQKNFFRAGVH